MDPTLDDLREIVESRDFNRLVGVVENNFFDCKDQPYRLAMGDTAKRELAKDVSAFANADGGYIFIGLRTEKSATHPSDEVKEVRPFDRSLADTDQHLKVLAEWIYPAIEGIGVKWIETTTDGKGATVITIPPQEERTKPFLITKTLDGDRRVEIVFGYVQRRSDATSVRSVIDLQRALRAGFNYDGELSTRLGNIEEMVERMFSDRTEIAEAEVSGRRIRERIAFALKHEDMEQNRLLVLAASSRSSGELQSIFSTGAGSIRRSLAAPPILRPTGWDLKTGEYSAHIIKGELIRVTSGRKVIDLYRDGTMIFGALATSSLLAWGENDVKLHSLALIETVVSFTRFYELVLNDFRERPTQVIFRVELRNMHLDGQKTFLLPGPAGSFYFHMEDERREAPDANWAKDIPANTEDYNPEAVAAEIVQEIYLWFGHEDDKIPYTKMENGTRQIDTGLIAGIR